MTQPTVTDARCIDCGYSLQGLDRNRCPECGRIFEPDDPNTFDSPLRRARARRLAINPLLGFLFTVAALAPAVYVVVPASSPDALMIWMTIAIVATGLWMRQRIRKKLLEGERDPQLTSERWYKGILIAVVFGFLLMPTARGWSCPHGSALGIGGVGIATSTVGGPCRNYEPLRSWRVVGDVYLWIAL